MTAPNNRPDEHVIDEYFRAHLIPKRDINRLSSDMTGHGTKRENVTQTRDQANLHCA